MASRRTEMLSPLDAGTVLVDAPDATPARTRRITPRMVVTGAAALWLAALVVGAVLAPVLPIADPKAAAGPPLVRPFGDYLLGTDQLGRDLFVRIVYGARTSLTIAVSATALALLVGVPLGLVAGYFRRKVDTIIVGLSDILLAFPGMVLLIVVAALMGTSPRVIVSAIAFFQVPTYIRITRASALNYSQREFVSASRGLGARELRIAVREVLPNVWPAVWTYAIATLGLVFLIEGSLSFLGLGVQPPTPVWGSMIEAGRPHLASAPHIVLVPSVVMFLTILSFNLLAERRRGGGARLLRPLR